MNTASTLFDNPALLAPPQVQLTKLANGGLLLQHPEPLGRYDRCVGDWLERWALETPRAKALAEVQADASGQRNWRVLNYGELRAQVGAVAQALLNLRLPAGRPIVVLSDNALDHALLLLAGLHIGQPVCTVSSAYCRLAGSDHSRIHAILQALNPALVYASDAATYGAAIADAPVQAAVVFSEGAEGHADALPFSQLLATAETPAVMQAFAAITPESHAKYLLTSGSTGQPKIVINHHRMLCANQQMLAQTLRFLDTEKPVLLDWLPWSHTFGGNHNLHLVLRNGGCLYIDDGRPMPGLIDKTLANLRQVQPTLYFNVPRGYEMLLPALEADEALARHFLGPLRMAFYAGAGMPTSTWKRLQTLAARVRSQPLWLTTSWGSTETAPANTFVNWPLDEPGVIGLPLPGVRLKLVPNGDKLEMRVAGEHIFPGYRDNPKATQQAFDDEGFYCIGDAGYLKDPQDPLQGVVFDGRVAEDFKLSSGTWVSVGTLRLRLVTALAPMVQDAVITGHERSEVGALVFLSEAGRRLAPAALAQALQTGLRSLKQQGGGSSQTASRLLVLADAPSAAAGEITDKGYINQRQVLSRRANEVLTLYEDAGHPGLVKL